MGHQCFFLPLDSNISSSWASSLSDSEYNCNIIHSTGSQAFELELKLHHQLSWVSTLLTHHGDPGTCQPPKSRETISYNKPLSIYINVK